MALTKATITNCETQEVITAMFNPTEYTVKKDNSWKSKPVVGKNVPKLDFSGGGAQTLTIELFFDRFEDKGDVRDDIKKLHKLTLIVPRIENDKTKRSRPPLCIFQWGPNWEFKAAVMSLSVRYTLFLENGTPCRATANLTLQEAEDEQEQPPTNPSSHALPGYRSRQVRPHDTLAWIAWDEFRDPGRWREIALANGIDDPLAISDGQILSIPPRA